MAEARPRVGISSCLVGERVRYDGGHKLDRELIAALESDVDLVPVCPEVECGLGVPREPMRLEARSLADLGDPRLVTVGTHVDLTDRVNDWADRRLAELADAGLSGFVFKARSPSSGLERVPVFDERGVAHPLGVGVFARAFVARFPDLPVAEDEQLRDPAARERFVGRVLAAARSGR